MSLGSLQDREEQIRRPLVDKVNAELEAVIQHLEVLPEAERVQVLEELAGCPPGRRGGRSVPSPRDFALLPPSVRRRVGLELAAALDHLESRLSPELLARVCELWGVALFPPESGGRTP